ncbi:MAG: hypothetical protein GY838_03740 [bacterium]|nr:hypothetical protein [bacterium]
MPVTNTDAILHYNVGVFGDAGYAVPNGSNDVGTLNPSIADLVALVGRNLFNIMHHEDADLRIPPSINTLMRVHKLYVRTGQILAGRALDPATPNMESQHVQPGGEVFTVFPVPYFKVRNPFLKRWAGWVLMSLAEAMQHTENRKSLEISSTFAGQIGQYIRRAYINMAIELFGKTATEATADGFLLTEEDFAGYNPSIYFTSTEMVDTVPRLDYVFTEDKLRVLAEGIPVVHLPECKPWPVNLTEFYRAAAAGPAPTENGEPTASATNGTTPIVPPAPGP